MAEVILDVGDAQVTVDVSAANVAVGTPSSEVEVEVSTSNVMVGVDTPTIDVTVPPSYISVYADTPNITVDLAGTPGKTGPQGPQGIPGPEGPPGPGGLAIQYVHIQSMLSPAWIVEHNMGKHPEVTCEDGAGSQIHGSVTYLDDNTLLVGFSYSITGRANCT